MERVKKGEKYWYIYLGSRNIVATEKVDYYNSTNDDYFRNNNYFHTKEEAEAMVRKIRAVLKGAEVIEMPSDKEIKQASYDCTNGYDDDQIPGFNEGVEWLKSKIVK